MVFVGGYIKVMYSNSIVIIGIFVMVYVVVLFMVYIYLDMSDNISGKKD